MTHSSSIPVRLAIFGGTFDPIHQAHLEIARAALEHCPLDRILLVPAAHPPHKTGALHTPYEHRLKMAQLACAAIPHVEVSRLEEGAESSYSIATIEKVRAHLAPADELFFLIGADAFADVRTWKRWQEVARAVIFLVFSRPGHTYHVPPEVRLQRIDTLDLPVSSSEIRRRLAAGERPPEIPAPVLAYILEHGLYGTGPYC